MGGRGRQRQSRRRTNGAKWWADGPRIHGDGSVSDYLFSNVLLRGGLSSFVSEREIGETVALYWANITFPKLTRNAIP